MEWNDIESRKHSMANGFTLPQGELKKLDEKRKHCLSLRFLSFFSA